MRVGLAGRRESMHGCDMRHAWGEGLPRAILTNADLSTVLDTSDEWITSRTGMEDRRVLYVSAIETATNAASRARTIPRA